LIPAVPTRQVDAAAAYDAYANRYDSLLSENLINAYMRRAMMAYQRSAFHSGDRLLELGCGTGDEALALAEHGCEVVAIDASTEMIAKAREKAGAHSLGRRVSFQVGYARELGALLPSSQAGTFDGAYSSFALSYEKDLSSVANALARAMRVGGTLLVASMNRLCGIEWAMAMASFHPSLAGRRLQDDTAHKVGTVQTPAYCRTPRETERAFRPGFEVVRRRALPVLLPPHYANRPLRRWPTLVGAMEKVDARVAAWPVFRDLGDHSVLWMTRSG